MWFTFRKQKKIWLLYAVTVLLDANTSRKKKRDQENKRQLIEFNALSDYQTVIIIIRQC